MEARRSQVAKRKAKSTHATRRLCFILNNALNLPKMYHAPEASSAVHPSPPHIPTAIPSLRISDFWRDRSSIAWLFIKKADSDDRGLRKMNTDKNCPKTRTLGQFHLPRVTLHWKTGSWRDTCSNTPTFFDHVKHLCWSRQNDNSERFDLTWIYWIKYWFGYPKLHYPSNLRWPSTLSDSVGLVSLRLEHPI